MIRITDRPYLFVDDTLVERHDGTELRLHSPVRANVALRVDAPWEGPLSGYYTVVAVDDGYRLYYRGWAVGGPENADVTCVAESADGIEWTRRNIWKREIAGTFANNVVWCGDDEISHNMGPFFDANPDAAPDARFKALGGLSRHGLFALASPDGIDWRVLGDGPVMASDIGEFDSLNTSFWDTELGCYAVYYRTWNKHHSDGGVRMIGRALSDDFVNWTDRQPLDLGDAPLEHFYTNAIRPYERDPGLYLGFPKRFVPDRKRHAEHEYDGLSDTVLISSRDGLHFRRQFLEAFVRPGTDQGNWTERNIMVAPGMIRTSPTEYSLYWSEHIRHHDHYLMRGTIRVDGFASLHAGRPGGRMTSVPVRIDGERLALNMSTSAAGSVSVALLDENEKAIGGYSADDCDELYGDDVERTVTWNGSPDVGRVRGRTVRVRLALDDAQRTTRSGRRASGRRASGRSPVR